MGKPREADDHSSGLWNSGVSLLSGVSGSIVGVSNEERNSQEDRTVALPYTFAPIFCGTFGAGVRNDDKSPSDVDLTFAL